MASYDKNFRVKNTITTGAGSNNEITYPTTDGTSGQAIVTNGSGSLSFATVLKNVVEDTTPQLGGALDLNGHDIKSDATGVVVIKVGSAGSLHVQDSATNTNRFSVNDSGRVSINEEYAFPFTDGTAGQVLTTNGSGSLSFTTLSETLQSVTDRGATSNNAITITHTAASSNTSTGALVVDGGVGIAGDVNVGGGELKVTGSSGSTSRIISEDTFAHVDVKATSSVDTYNGPVATTTYYAANAPVAYVGIATYSNSDESLTLSTYRNAGATGDIAFRTFDSRAMLIDDSEKSVNIEWQKLLIGDTANTTATSVIEGSGTILIDPAPTAGDANGVVIIKGDLQVDGTTTTVNSTDVTIDDLNIILASGSANSSVADGAGFTIDGANKSITWNHTNQYFTANSKFEADGFVVSGSTGFLKADGTVDTNTYLTSYTETDPIFTAHTTNNITDGTGFLKNNGSGTWSYDNSTYLTSETNTSLTANSAAQTLTYTDETGTANSIDLSWAVDDTNLARITSGTVDANTGIATFTRDDTSTFTVDFSALFDDTNLARITSGTVTTANSTLTLTRSDATVVDVDVSDLLNLNNVVEDTTPQLGGNLSTNSYQIQFGKATLKDNASEFEIDGGSNQIAFRAGGPNLTEGTIRVTSTGAAYITSANVGTTTISYGRDVHLQAGSSTNTSSGNATKGGNVQITAGNASVTGTSREGGNVNITAGDGEGAAGSVVLTSGTSTGTAGYIQLDGQKFPGSIGANNQVLSVANSATGELAWSTVSSSGGGISNVVEDTTPQLGGDLDLNSKSFSGTASFKSGATEMLSITDGAGITMVESDNWPLLINTANTSISLTAGTSESGGGRITLRTENQDRIEIANTGPITFNNAYSFPTSDGSNGQVLTTDGSGNLSFTTVSSGGIGLTDLSVTVATAGTANLSYDNANGVFTYTPPDLSGYLTSESNNIQYENVKTYTVTVGTKDATHPQFNNGSANGYKINGTFAPFLHMVPGMTYRFDQSDSSNSGHPLVFYYDEGKTTAYTTGVTNNGTPGSAGAYTEIVISESTPSTLYYQCSAHEYMGWGMNISTHNLTGFDTDDLAEGSTNLYYTTTRFNTDFSNKSTTDLSEGTNLYHTTARARGAISGTGDISYDSSTGVISFNNNSGYLTSETYSTANDIITDLKTVDGTGSGLDADLLDGQEGSHYLDYANFTSTPTSILDFGISDGTAGQVLQTDGSGNFSFTTVSGGGGAQAGYAGYEDYYYNVSSNTATFGTASSTHDKVQVFKNGVYLDDSAWSFNANTGIVTLTNDAVNGDEIAIWGFNSTTLDNHELFAVDSSGNVTLPGTLQIGNHRKEGSLTSTIATTNATNVVMYASADYVGAKLIVTITDGTTGDTQITEALILTVNGGTPKITTYGTMYTSGSALASFDVANVSTNTALEVTMASANSSTVKVAYTLIDA